MNIRPYPDDEYNTLPHVILTSDDEWNPTILDYSTDEMMLEIMIGMMKFQIFTLDIMIRYLIALDNISIDMASTVLI